MTSDKSLIDSIKLVNNAQSNKTSKKGRPPKGQRVMTIEQLINHVERESIYNPNYVQTKNKQKIIKKAKKQLENNKSAISNPKSSLTKCCICFENIKQKMVLIPCGHTTVCNKCQTGLNDKKCPVCQELFTQCIKLHL